MSKTWISINKRKPNTGGIVWGSFVNKHGVHVVPCYRSGDKFFHSDSGAEIAVEYWKGYYTPKPPKLSSFTNHHLFVK